MIGLLAVALAAEPVAFDGPPWHGAWLLPRDGGALLVLSGPDGTWTVDPRTGSRAPLLDRPIADAVVADVDGDGARELVTCGGDGLVARPWEPGGTSRELSPTPCGALGVVRADRTWLVSAGTELDRHGLGAGGPVHHGPFAPAPAGPIRLVPGGDALAVLGGDGLSVWDPDGERRAGAGVPVDGAARLEEGWAWTAGGDVYGAAAGTWFPDARAIVAVDLDADGTPEPAVIHPGAALIGWLDDGVEHAEPVGFAPRALRVGDVDGDGGADLVAIGDVALRVWPAAGAPPPVQLVAPWLVPAPTRPLLGVPVPLFQGTDGTLASGRAPARRMVVGGFGVAIGGQLNRSTIGIPASPAGVLTVERFDRPLTPWIGGDTAPLFVLFGDQVNLHLLMLSAGLSAGGPHLRVGPLVQAGLLGAGAGGRALWLPLETRNGTLMGLEWRAVVRASPSAWEPTGEITLAWTTAFPMGGNRAAAHEAPGVVVHAPEDRARGTAACRRFGVTLGGTAGGSSVENAWDFVGSGQRQDLAWTPSGSVWCESGAGASDLLVSVDAAPWFAYRIPWDQGDSDITVRHMGSATVGWALGSDLVRIGPIASAGVWVLGGGGRVALTPIQLRRAGSHGVEARALALWPSADAWEASLSYTAWFDPRR